MTTRAPTARALAARPSADRARVTMPWNALMIAAFVAVAAMSAHRAAADFNVPGDPTAGHYGLADFRDGIYYPTVAFLAGADPYDPGPYRAAYPVYYAFPWYSPIDFVVHLPLATMSLAVASWTYFALTLVGVLGIALASLGLAGLAVTPARIAGIASLVLLSRPGQWNQFLGQFGVTLALACYAALYWARRRPWLAGLGLAVATIKPTYALPLGVLLLVRGDRRAVVRGAVVAFALTIVPAVILLHRAGGVAPFVDVLGRSRAAFVSETEVDARLSPYRVDAAALASRVAGGVVGGGVELAVFVALLATAAWGVRRTTGADAAARRLQASIVCLAVVAATYHQVYDLILLTFPLLAVARGRCGMSPRAHAAVTVLLTLPAVNYLASAKGVALLGLTGTAWAAAASVNSVAVLAAFVLCIAAGAPRARPA